MLIPKQKNKQTKTKTKTKQTTTKKTRKKQQQNRKVDETLHCVTCVWLWPLTRIRGILHVK